jgi:hypothetical protein
MVDGDARTLIERVVQRADRGTATDIDMRRGIVQSDEGLWDFTIALALDGHIEHARLPSNLGPKLAGKLRAKLGEEQTCENPWVTTVSSV